MVGPFPPPVHGMASVNAKVLDALHKARVEPLVIDLAAPSLEQSLRTRLSRLPRVLRGLVRLVSTPTVRGGTLYVSVSGGLGQFLELPFIVLARLYRMRLFLHHHSFAYLDAPRLVTAWLTGLAGRNAIHLVLSKKMAEQLQSSYGIRHVTAISNAVFFVSDGSSAVTSVRRHLRTVGFLSNIAREKGVFEFLDLLASAHERGLSLRGKLAGPFKDAKTEQEVRSRLGALSNVEYVGPKYGAEKDAFFRDTDALVFATRYVNEAEPLTLHEAMSRGVPVIAYGRGCIPEIVGLDCGKVIDPSERFVPAALAQIEVWINDPLVFANASRMASQRFAETYSANKERWQALLDDLTDGRASRTVKGSKT